MFPLLILGLAACKPPPEQRQFMPQASAAHGKAVIERVGCGSCHLIPGVRWPQGKVGPALDGLAQRALIAGKLPNEPDVLAAYIRNAPALVPGSGMPAMPVSEAEARDIAAYLYEQGAK
ncbi:c-type cytochrome [Sphingomonas sp. LHG3406-1]|uniref:c-type cytochrome n=1 Tax=Sphingomonas sp. LHG3406-1 TaxID=2804617 RepID=UPI002616895A|nr:c-type cytochrome [Sphingomonas sp. LHG3406-1]